VVETDFDGKCSARHGLHMNHLGKEKRALKTANIITKLFLKQEEIISLYWKTQCEVSVRDSSDKHNIILQEDSLRQPHQ
jgi:hypothetical protein